MKISEPTPLNVHESIFARLCRKIRSSVRLSACVRILIGIALPVLPILFLLGLVALGVADSPLSRFVVKWTFGLVVAFALVGGGVAVLQGLMELVTGSPFKRISGNWNKLGKRGTVVLGIAIYVVVLGVVLWLFARAR